MPNYSSVVAGRLGRAVRLELVVEHSTSGVAAAINFNASSEGVAALLKEWSSARDLQVGELEITKAELHVCDSTQRAKSRLRANWEENPEKERRAQVTSVFGKGVMERGGHRIAHVEVTGPSPGARSRRVVTPQLNIPIDSGQFFWDYCEGKG